MAQTKSSKAQEFDTLVIGGGLGGLLAANALEATGRNVALLEAHETLGGSSRPWSTDWGIIDYGLKVFPSTPASHAALDWLETQIGESIERREIQEPPINYDEGKFKPYVGFGATPVATSSEIEAYALAARLQLSSTPKDWVTKLGTMFSGTVFTQSHATKLIVDDGFVIEVLVNGAKRLSAREVVFSASPQLLPSLLGENILAPRIRQKLLKGDFWTSVNLDLIHRTPVTDSSAIHVFKGANEEPSVGAFSSPAESGIQVSQWTTLIPRDQTDDEEIVAAALKQIKRQIKRAYEQALDDVARERILVIPSSHGSLANQFDRPGQLPKIENLWLTSAFFAETRNTIGTIQQTKHVVEMLGPEKPLFDDAGSQTAITAEA